MIRFRCLHCSAGLRVDDARAGTLFACPKCGKKVRAPAAADAPKEVEELEEVEELDEVEDEEAMDVVEADDDEPRDERGEEDQDRPRRSRRKVRHLAPADEDEGHRDFLTRNRFMGLVGIILGIGFTIGALVSRADFRNYLTTAYNFGGCFALVLGVSLLLAGVFYVVRG